MSQYTIDLHKCATALRQANIAGIPYRRLARTIGISEDTLRRVARGTCQRCSNVVGYKLRLWLERQENSAYGS
jgi:hypothetical protein